MYPDENADDSVVTSAPPLSGIPAGLDLEETWDGEKEAPAQPTAAVSTRARLDAALAAAGRIGWDHDEECPHRYCDGEPGGCEPCDLTEESPCGCSGAVVLELAAAVRAGLTELDDALTGARGRAALLERQVENAEARVLFHASRADAAEAYLRDLVTRGLDAVPVDVLRAALDRRQQQIPQGGPRCGGGAEVSRSGAPVSPPARELSSPPEPGPAVGLGGAL